MKMKDDYNKEIEAIALNGDYLHLNNYVMNHTYDMCRTNDILLKAIEDTFNKSYMVKENDGLDVKSDGRTANVIVSRKRTLEAASFYKGKKVAVLNFANNHVVGGSPWISRAQEESLCRISTLYPCLLKFEESFYQYHKELYLNGKINEMGNDDLIYLPKVCVFKTDDNIPKLMEEDKWYYVDVITQAAPELYMDYNMEEYKSIMYKRLKRIMEIAKLEKVEVLILGAYGCGAFHNPPEIVASIFKDLCNEYHFDTIEFAVYSKEDDKHSNYNVFKNIIDK